jgi:hypothetical protein
MGAQSLFSLVLHPAKIKRFGKAFLNYIKKLHSILINV